MIDFEKYGFKKVEAPGITALYEFEDKDSLNLTLGWEEGDNDIEVYCEDEPVGRMAPTNQSLALLLKTFSIRR